MLSRRSWIWMRRQPEKYSVCLKEKETPVPLYPVWPLVGVQASYRSSSLSVNFVLHDNCSGTAPFHLSFPPGRPRPSAQISPLRYISVCSVLLGFNWCVCSNRWREGGCVCQLRWYAENLNMNDVLDIQSIECLANIDKLLDCGYIPLFFFLSVHVIVPFSFHMYRR